jgi:hypothetical protein
MGKMNVGENLKRLMASRGMSYADVRRAGGPAVSTISRIADQDKLSPDTHGATLHKLAKALGLTYPVLIEELNRELTPSVAGKVPTAAHMFKAQEKTMRTPLSPINPLDVENLSLDQIEVLEFAIAKRRQALAAANGGKTRPARTAS